MRAATGLAVALVAAGALGCGDEETATDAPPKRDRKPPTKAAESPPTTPEAPPVDRGIGSARGVGSGPSETARADGREPIRLPDGSIAYLPVKPTRTQAPPSPSCTADQDGDVLPPTPRVRARRLQGNRLLIQVSFASLPRRCRPKAVQLSLDVNDDPLGPDSALFPLRRLRKPLVIEIPERVRDADVIRASAVTRSGATSDANVVLIRPPAEPQAK